jgi:HrpA-like RNA helicase
MAWFRARLNLTGVANRVLILKSETASGKSTAFPPELFKAFVRGSAADAPGIICTQPRVLTAIENVNEILNHYSDVLRLGESIGWSTKYNKLRPTSVSLLSATIGTLTQQLKTLSDEEIIAKYRFILIDETHERGLDTDMAIYMLKNLLRRNAANPKCPFVVLMSATFEPQSFLDYFGLSLMDNFIWCTGATAHIDEVWDWNDGRTVNNYPQAAATVVERIINENRDDDWRRADILIFMPGAAEIKMTMNWLIKLNKKLAGASKSGGKAGSHSTDIFSLLQIDSEAVQTRNPDFMKVIYIDTPEHVVTIDGTKYTPKRRVIISTNVAETGLTLDNLKYVIDAGFNREIEYNPVYGLRALLTKPAPKSRIRQRRGRVGRKFPGVFYPLYPKFIHERLQLIQYPNILVEDITPILIDMIMEQLKSKALAGDRAPEFVVQDIDMIDVPTPDALHSAIEKLYMIGYISMDSIPYGTNAEMLAAPTQNMPPAQPASRLGLTKLGVLSTSFTMIPAEISRMILAAYSWGANVLDVITIAAYLLLQTRINAMKESDDPMKPATKLEVNWLAVYKAGLPSAVTAGTKLLYKIRLLLADDFIHGLILFNAIKYIISSADAAKSLSALEAWCGQNNVQAKAALELIRVRDDLIEQMIGAGLDVFAGEDAALARATRESFMDMITRLKYCIYDGFRSNMLTHDGTVYRTTMGLAVKVPKLFRVDELKSTDLEDYKFIDKALPRFAMYKELRLKYNQKTAIYEIVVDQISAADGFISIDQDFVI